MQLPPLPNNESERLAALQQTQLLDSPAEQRFDRITAMVKSLFDCDVVLISLIDAKRQWFKSKQGLEVVETECSISFCGHTILDDVLMMVPDATKDPRFANNPLVKDSPNIRFYAGMPLRSPEGYNLGTLCIIDGKSRHLDQQQQVMLQQFAQMIESEIMQTIILQHNVELDNTLKDVLDTDDKLNAIIETNQLATWKLNVQTGATRLNKRWAEIIGYTLAELQPTNINLWLSLIHPDDYQRSQQALTQHFLQQTEFYQCEIRIRHRHGHWIWVRDHGKVITWDPQQQPRLVFGTLEDISEQKQQQLTLQLQQKLMRIQASILSSKDIFSVEDISWTYFSQQIALALNVDRVSIWLQNEALTHLTCHYLQQHGQISTPNLIDISAEQFPHFFGVLKQDSIIAAEDVNQCSALFELTDDYLKPEKIISKLDAVIMSDVGVAGIICVETTEQQRQWHSEEQRFMLTMSAIASNILSLIELKRLNHAYQHTNNLLSRTSKLATIGLWEISIPGHVIHWNNVTRQIHEVDQDYLPNSQVAFKFYSEGEDRKRVQQLFEQAVTANIPFDDSFQIVTAKGNHKWVRVVAVPEFFEGECQRVYGLFQDITAIKQSYFTLQQVNNTLEVTQQRLDVASENARIGFWQAWPDTGELWWSSVVYQMFGLDEANTTPSVELFHQLVHPDDLDVLMLSEQKAETSGVHDMVHRIITADGSVRWVHELAKLMPQSNSNIPTIVGTVQDITEKVIAEQAHYRLTSLLQTVLDAASEVSIIAIDTQGVIQLVNKGAETMLGYQAEELIQQQSLCLLHAADEVSARAAELSEQLAKPILGIEVFTIIAQQQGFERRRWIYQCKDGTELLVQVIVTPMRDEQNTITGYLCLAHDITLQEHLSFELNQFFDLSQSILCISSLTGHFIRMNKAFTQVLGHSQAELLQKPLLYYVHPDDVLKTQQEIAKMVDGCVSVNFFNRMQHKDGHYIFLEWFTALDPDTGKFYSAAQDITERLKLDQLKSEFVSTVSHELRTPITSITGALGLVLSGVVGELPAEPKKLLNIASSNCNRLANLINDLLDIEKLHAGKMQVELATHRLSKILRRAVEDNQTYSNTQNIELSLHLAAEAETWQVQVDEFRFLQIMANLLSNAIKFSLPNSKVIVSAQIHQLAAQSMLVIAVADQGSGIAEKYKPQIFDKFSQADASDAREKGGTGLGLALSKELAEAMHGTLSFESVEQQGATFYLHLPVVVSA